MAPTQLSVLLFGCALANVLLASFIWARHNGKAGPWLAGLLAADTFWGLMYAIELVLMETDSRYAIYAGLVKYVGIVAMAPLWVMFTARWAGWRLPRWGIAALWIEPALVLLFLIPPSHVIRYVDGNGEVQSGALFYVHMLYMMVVMVGASFGFVRILARRVHHYRFEVFVLALAVVLPFGANIAFNLPGIGSTYDYTPVAFTISGAALTWGLLQEHLIKLAPIAHSQVVDGMQDGVIVLDSNYRVVECNPAGLRALGLEETGNWRSRPLPSSLANVAIRLGTTEVRIEAINDTNTYEAQVSDLPGQIGHQGGRVIVLRDISERRRLERQRATMLAEQARVAETLSRSLRPPHLPEIPGVGLGAQYRPAGGGEEIGGDFYDVYPVDDQWAFSLGDVSGKGARSAAVTALARYTLRALTKGQDSPSQTIRVLNAQLLAETEDQEIYLTVVHGRLRPVGDSLEVTLSLGGHPKPFLVPADVRREIIAVGEPGTAIGLLDEVETTDTTLLLRPGDAIVAFTDGVSEARHGREFFGEEGLAEVLEQLRGADAGLIAEGVLDAVMRYQEDVAADDIAVLVLQAPGVALNFDLPVQGFDARPEEVTKVTPALGQ